MHTCHVKGIIWSCTDTLLLKDQPTKRCDCQKGMSQLNTNLVDHVNEPMMALAHLQTT